jgi:hypothetical protein
MLDGEVSALQAKRTTDLIECQVRTGKTAPLTKVPQT